MRSINNSIGSSPRAHDFFGATKLFLLAAVALISPPLLGACVPALAQSPMLQQAPAAGQTQDQTDRNNRRGRGLGSNQEFTISPDLLQNSHKTVQVLVELLDEPAVKVYARAMARSGLPKDQLKAAAVTATRAQMNLIKDKQQILAATLTGPRFGAKEIYRVQRALNAIAIQVDESKLEAIRNLPGVKAVHTIELEYPTTAVSMPFIGAPSVWGNTIGLPSNITGDNVKIGIIDTGIDYQHPNFGGTGVLADYQANPRTTISPGLFPTAKVAGGTDFAGDAYNGNNTPTPDPNPMDCNGHGSHVAGIAGGLGVNSDGTTYTGAYGPSTPFSSLKIGPGAAPGAKLYAIRVFGCSGGTGLTVQGIDWAIDPNGDNDFSDHLDVINMSLGSSFGQPSNTSLLASENAALAGIVVVAAAGNDSDTYFIASAPSNSGRSISVAASVDNRGAGALLTVNSPPGIAGNYAAASNAFGNGAPAPSGQTANVVLVNDGTASPSLGCSALTNAAAVAGNIALIDRGTCGFQVKVANAQAAGAIGAIVANNAVGDPTLVTMGATAGQPNITIPAIFISNADGATIKAQLGSGVNATLGAATTADTLASFSSRGPRSGSPTFLKPDIAAPGLNITSTQTGITCLTGGGCITPSATGFLAGGQTLTISGTSMATPHVAGVMALLKQLHPDWSVEELKALVMNGAIHDITIGANGSGPRYGPGRVGAGRIDAAASASLPVTAFNGDDSGLVSVSFDPPLLGSTTATKRVRVVNHSSTSQTYTLGIDQSVGTPGVSFSFPGGSSITIPPAQSVEFDVQMSANANSFNHTFDPTIAPTQAAPSPLTSLGSLARHWLTEAGGYITFSKGSTVKLRVPVYLGGRPASSMFGPAAISTGGAPTGSTTIPLSGTGVCSGTLGAGPTCTGTFPTTEASLVTPFELQAINPRNTSVPAYADIQYAGVAYNPSSGLLMFGISTWGNWSSPHDVAFNILIDPTNTGNFTRVLFNSDPGTMGLGLFGTSSADSQDDFITATFNTSTSGVGTQQFVNLISAAGADTAIFKNRMIILAATPASLGITGTSFHWKMQTTTGTRPLAALAGSFETVGPAQGFFWDRNAQGFNFGGGNLFFDLNGASIPVTWNTANITANGSLGALLLHSHNVDGTQAQVIPLDTAAGDDIAVTQSSSPSPMLGQNVTLTITASNNGPGTATGVAVTDLLPAGLTYISDDSSGAYNPSTGTWTVGSLAASGSAALHITATVTTTDSVTNTAQRTASSPLDPNPANDIASVTIQAPREADLAVTATASVPTVAQGNSVTYNLTVNNIGDDPAYNVQLSEGFPSFPTLNPTSFTASTGVFNPATGIWSVPSLGKGFSETLSLTVTAPATCVALSNTSSVTAETGDPSSANNSATASSTITGAVPSVNTNPISQLVCNGSTAGFTASGTGSPTPTVQWQQSTDGGATFQNIGGATSTTLSFAVTPSMNNNQYRAVFTSNCGSSNSSAATLSVGLAPTITLNPTNQSSAGGGNVTFTAAASGTPAPSVQWQVSTNGGALYTNIPGATSTTLTVAAPAVASGNLYRAVFTNQCGSATTTAAGLLTFDLCIQDNTTKNILQINTTTGDYKFIRCSDGFTLSGKGTIKIVNSVINLTDSKSDRRITASFNQGQLTGSATVTIISSPGVSTTYRITDTTSRGKGCSCTMP